MTRFARAKGSKASNERICEEATSWEEMKQQLIERKKEIEDDGERKKIEQVRNTNYQNFLKDKNEQDVNKSEWAEFPNSSTVVENKKSIEHSHENSLKNRKRKMKKSLENEADSGVNVIKTSRKKHKEYINNDGNSDNEAPVEISSKIEISMPQIKKSKQKKKKLSIVVENNADIERVQEVQIEQNEKTENKMKSGNSNEKKRKLIDMESLTEPEKKKIEKKQEKRRKQIEKKKLKKQMKGEESKKVEKNEGNILYQKDDTAHDLSKSSKRHYKSPGEISTKNKNNLNNNKIGSNTPKKEKLKTGEFKRRKSFQPDKVMINGKEVALSYFEGFPIKKEDAINLKNLRKQMISKGLPRSEINRTIKLERRKAEKALAREKKNVCFNCRKFGHNVAECSEMSKGSNQELFDSNGTGICFKCGSSEHTSFACKVVQGANYKFATCFICKEQGHISRQCPDNARGLYPKGGCCNVCGDVTHLKKDCPQFRSIQEKEQEKFQVETISSGNPDDMDKEVNIVKNTVRPNKIIKF